MAKVRLSDGRVLNFQGQPTSQDIEEATQQIGEIREAPGLLEKGVARFKRGAGLQLRGLIGDVPFARKLLPEQVKKIEPTTFAERVQEPGIRLARDIFGLKGIGKLGAARTALRGAGLGITTAGTEKPGEILKAGGIGAVALPVIKRGSEVASGFISRAARKGLKTTQQIWQDLLRAGFTVEKSTVQRVQQKGISKIFTKTVNPELGTRNRSEEAFLSLADRIHNSTISLRKRAGSTVGRWRDLLFKNERIRVSLENPKKTFQTELGRPGVSAFEPITTPAAERLRSINVLLSAEDEIPPSRVYAIIDKLDDMISESKQGVLSLGKNEGRIVANLARDLRQQIYKSAPRNISNGLRAAEEKFSKIADTTDDVFKQLSLRRQGPARTERIGAAEKALTRGLKEDTPVEERQIWTKLNELLPRTEKFIELYKDVFAAQDLQREGVGFLLRRLLLAPRIAARGLSIAQPPLTTFGLGLRAGGRTAEKVIPAGLFRKGIESKERVTRESLTPQFNRFK